MTIVESRPLAPPRSGVSRGGEGHRLDAVRPVRATLDPYRVDAPGLGPVLPTPPSGKREKYSCVQRRLWILTLATLVGVPPLILCQAGFVASSMRLWVLAPLFALTPLVALIRLLLETSPAGIGLEEHNALVREWNPRRFATVDLMLPTCGEPMGMLRNTWRHVAAMAWAYPGVVNVDVLDDAARGEVSDAVYDFGFPYAVRPRRGWFKKALLWRWRSS